MFKLASWNVNSLKIRLDHILDWLSTHEVDVLALQETKLIDDHFPVPVFLDRGYEISYFGQKTYNGVAMISRHPLLEVTKGLVDDPDPQKRMIATTIGDIRVINLYVPNGSGLESDKYAYKLDWLSKMTRYIADQMELYPKLAVVGDFNIAPEDLDVHDPSEWIGSILVSPPERAAFQALLALGLNDSFRAFSKEGDLYSWWDYRAASFRRNRGARIDHILLSDALMKECTHCHIDKIPRSWERPSDHAPIIVHLNS